MDSLLGIIASRAPRRATARTASAISGWRAATTGSKSLRQPPRHSSHSVGSRGRIERRFARRPPGRATRRPSDRRRPSTRRKAGARSRTPAGQRRQRRHLVAAAAAERRAAPGEERHVRAEPAAPTRASRSRSGGTRPHPHSSRSAAIASALPPPRPACVGTCLSIVTSRPAGSGPAQLGRPGPRRRTTRLVSSSGASLPGHRSVKRPVVLDDCQRVGELDGLEDLGERVDSRRGAARGPRGAG